MKIRSLWLLDIYPSYRRVPASPLPGGVKGWVCLHFLQFLLLFSLLLTGVNSWAAPDQPMCEGTYCLYPAGSGTVGGGGSDGVNALVNANMYPYQTGGDRQFWFDKSVAFLDEGNSFRNNELSLFGTFDPLSPRGKMLLDTRLNYETADPDFLTKLSDIERKLISARNTFAYQVAIEFCPQVWISGIGWMKDCSAPQTKLIETIKTLANIYLMVGDELLIDSLEYRFSSDTIGIDSKLDEQICLLGFGRGKYETDVKECKLTDTATFKYPTYGAQVYYEKAVNSFLYGFSPSVGTNIYASDYYDDTIVELFNLSTERLSMDLREKSSRLLVRKMSPDSSQGWQDARQAALGALKDSNVTTYLAAAAIAQKQSQSFGENGGDSLVGALNGLRRQGNIYSGNLNPLGYDNRYIPAYDFEDLYPIATGWLVFAKDAKAANDAEKREFDSNIDSMKNEYNALNTTYITSIASYTGCPVPDINDPTQVDQFLICTGEAGGDLFDCPTNSETEFTACIATKTTTKGVLLSKYRNIMEAQLRLDSARQRRQTILESINLENERNGKLVELKRSYYGAETVLLDKYYEKLKNARTETDTYEEQSTRDWNDDEWKKKKKMKTHTTIETFYIRNDQLKLDTDKEREHLQITADYEIQQVNLDTAYAIKNLLLQEAESEIEIQLAAFQKNSAVADFDNLFKEKENLWFLFDKSYKFVQSQFTTDKLATMRILRSQAALELSEALNYSAHYAYLAAKAFEYKHLRPLIDEPVGGGRVRITDLFKAQTPSDIEAFLLKLNSLDTLNCPWGTFDPQYYTVSLAYNVLGLTDRYLDPDGDGYTASGKTIAEARKEAVQAFISNNINSQGKLQFSFSLSEDNSFFANSGLYNLKIWNGPAPSACDALVGDVKGLSVSLITTQTSNLRPKINLKQKGHSSLRNSSGDILEYIPVYDYHFLFEGSGDYSPVKQGEFVAFINTDPRNQGGTGSWTGAFKGRGLASSDWEMTVFDWNPMYSPTDLSKLKDVWLQIDTIGECCYE